MVSSARIDETISDVLPIPHIFVNLLVVFLSLRCVRHSIVKIFALNLMIPSLVYSVYSDVAAICKLTGNGDHLGMSTNVNRTILDFSTDFVYYFCGYNYRALGILLVGITYVSFARPMFAKKHFEDNIIHRAFSVAHIFAFFASVVSTFSQNQSELLFVKNLAAVPVNWTDYVEGALETSTFAVFVILYICIKAIIAFRRKTLGSTEALRNDKNRNSRKRQLMMILLYITPPNILLIPNSVCSDINTIVFAFDNVVYRNLCLIKIYFHSTVLACRLFIASFTILIAFTDYREAVCSLFGKEAPVFANGAASSRMTPRRDGRIVPCK